MKKLFMFTLTLQAALSGTYCQAITKLDGDIRIDCGELICPFGNNHTEPLPSFLDPRIKNGDDFLKFALGPFNSGNMTSRLTTLSQMLERAHIKIQHDISKAYYYTKLLSSYTVNYICFLKPHQSEIRSSPTIPESPFRY